MKKTIRGKAAKLSRRTFIVGSAAAGGGLALGFNLPLGFAPAVAQSANEGAEVNAWVFVKPDDTCAIPQPYFVPVRPTCSRMTHKSGVSASTSTSRMLPLMLSFAISFPLANCSTRILLLFCRQRMKSELKAPARLLLES